MTVYKSRLAAARDKLRGLPYQTRLEVMKGVSVRKKKNGLTVLTLHYSAIPDRDPSTPKGSEWYAREHKKYSSEARWKKEQEIDPYATGGEAVFGRILSDYYDIIVISDPYWYPDPRWDVVGGFDHGGTNATCLLKGYIPRASIDPKTGIARPAELYLCGEYYSFRREGWANNVDMNCKAIMRGGIDENGQDFEAMPDIDRARWIMADPSIFWEDVQQAQGKPTAIYATYRKNNFYPMRSYDGIRSDVTFVEWMMSDYWGGIADGVRPRCYIVCRNPSDRPQPGMHPYDCPNLLWEMKRARRVEMTGRQLLTRNASEALQDKNNHARDALKYMTGILRNPTAIPDNEGLAAAMKGLNPTTANIRARFLMSELALGGKLLPDGTLKKGAAPKAIDLRRSPGVIGRPR